MDVSFLMDIASRDRPIEELTSDDSSCSSDDSSIASSPVIKTRPSTILIPNSNRPSKIVPIVTSVDTTDQLIDVEEGEPQEIVLPFSDGGDSDTSDDSSDVADQNDRGVHEFTRDIIGEGGMVVGTATFEVCICLFNCASIDRLCHQMVVKADNEPVEVVEDKMIPCSPSSPTFKRRMSDALTGLGSRSSTKALVSPPSSPTSFTGQRRMSGALLGLLGSSSPEKSQSSCCLSPKTVSIAEQIAKKPEDFTAVMFSEGYSHLFRVPVSRLQEMKEYFM